MALDYNPNAAASDNVNTQPMLNIYVTFATCIAVTFERGKPAAAMTSCKRQHATIVIAGAFQIFSCMKTAFSERVQRKNKSINPHMCTRRCVTIAVTLYLFDFKGFRRKITCSFRRTSASVGRLRCLTMPATAARRSCAFKPKRSDSLAEQPVVSKNVHRGLAPHPCMPINYVGRLVSPARTLRPLSANDRVSAACCRLPTKSNVLIFKMPAIVNL
jgi:hypothetical protein